MGGLGAEVYVLVMVIVEFRNGGGGGTEVPTILLPDFNFVGWIFHIPPVIITTT